MVVAAEMVARRCSRSNLGGRGAASSAVAAAMIAVREGSEIGLTRGIDRM